MISITVNKQPQQYPANISLEMLMQQLNLAQGHAVAINQTFIPRTAHASTVLQDGDQIDILTPMQGG